MGPLPRSQSRDSSKKAGGVEMSDSNVKFLQGQLQLHSDLSKALEDKLQQSNRQINNLHTELREKQSAFQELQRSHDEQVTHIQDLEQTCVARSAKVSQLVQVIAAKKTSEIQEVLLERSLQVADLVEERHKLERDIVHLEEELATSKVAAMKLKQDRDKNNKLLLELSDIVRTLNKIAVDYERVDNTITDDKSANSGSTASMPLNQPLRNVKRKIQAIEQDRQRLVQERDRLKRDNEAKDAQLAALEASFHLFNNNDESQSTSNDNKNAAHREAYTRMKEWGPEGVLQKSRGGNRTTMPEHLREESYDDFVEEKKEDDHLHSSTKQDSGNAVCTEMGRSLSVVEEDVASISSSSSASSKSSFSTLEVPPPSAVDIKEHEELKGKFEKALDVIEKLRNELSKRIRKESQGNLSLGGRDRPNHKDVEQSATQIDVLRRNLDISREHVQNLESTMEQIKMKHDQETRDYQNIIQELSMKLEEHKGSLEEAVDRHEQETKEIRKMNGILKQQYEDLETEYSMKIESLEQKIRDTEAEAQASLAELKQSNEQYVENKEREHNAAIESNKQAMHDLKFEYDTFLEVHLKTEEEAKKEKELYKEALKKIITLEAHLSSANAKFLATNLSYQEETTAIKAKKTEAVQKYNKLKHGYELLKEHHAEELEKMSQNLQKSHQENQHVVADYEKRVMELEQKYKEIRNDFDEALINHGKKMQSADFKYEKLRAEYDASVEDQRRSIDDIKSRGEQQLVEMIEKVKTESRHKLDEHVSNSKEEMDKLVRDTALEISRLKKDHDDELERLRIDSQNALKQRRAEFLEILDQCQRDKEDSETNLLSRLDEQKKKMQELERDTSKQIEKQRYESTVVLGKVQAKLKQDIERLTTENKSLLGHKREGDDMKVLYRELASSYQSSLFKIECLLKTKRGMMCTEAKESSVERNGTVMEKIRALEDSSKRPAKSGSDCMTSQNRATVDATFQRDFTALLVRLGHTEGDRVPIKDEDVDQLTTSSFACSSISLESVLARKNAKVASNLTETDSTEATDNLSSFQDGVIQKGSSSQLEPLSILVFQDLLLHFVRSKTVLASLLSRSEVVSSHVQKGSGIDDDLQEVVEARIVAEQIQAENIRYKFKENTADIVSQAREKEFRLLERQFRTLKEQFEKVATSSSGSAGECLSISSKTKLSKDDPTYPLGIALSSMTSDGGPHSPTVSLDVSEKDCLRKQLLGAELKAQVTKRKLDKSKSEVEEARKQREQGSKSLQTAMGRLRNMDKSSIYRRMGLSANDLDASENDHHELDDGKTVFPLPIIQVDKGEVTAVVSYLDGESEHKEDPWRELVVTQSMLSIQDELKQARDEARLAKEKQMEREENLRDVIQHYKLLQKENEKLSKSLNHQQESSKQSEDSFSGVDSEHLVEAMEHECNDAHAALNNFQEQLDTVQQSLQDAKKNSGVRREAIDKYKRVQEQFMAVLDEKKEIEKALYNKSHEETEQVSPLETTTMRIGTEANYHSHRGTATASGPRMRGTVKERILMLEAAKAKNLPSPPSYSSSPDEVSSVEATEDNNGNNMISGSAAQGKKSKTGKKRGFLRGSRLAGFSSKLPSITTKAGGGKMNK